jgi:translocator assembly and maintenance protein 41
MIKLDGFPRIRCAVAYGSGAFPQAGRRPGSLLDLLFAVDSPIGWHRDNMAVHPRHYSTQARFILDSGCASGFDLVQGAGGGVYYNTDVTVGGRRCKYGVIGYQRAVEDLKTWCDFYFAARLQKPVSFLIADDALSRMNEECNRRSALIAALKLADTKSRTAVPWEEVLARLIGLSYNNDPRTWLGFEDRHKISRILQGQFEQLVGIYAPAAAKLGLQCDRGRIYGDLEGVRLLRTPEYKLNGFRASTVQSVNGLVTARPAVVYTYLCDKFNKR